jgi:hypothetical protein
MDARGVVGTCDYDGSDKGGKGSYESEAHGGRKVGRSRCTGENIFCISFFFM